METKTNLQRLCEAFGWQGGTIFQASEELLKYCSSELSKAENLIAMSEPAITLMIEIYKTRKAMGLIK